MASPSEASREEDRLKLLKEIPRLEKQMPKHKKIIDEREEEGLDLVRQFLESDESDLASAKSTLELMEQDLYVGSVHEASLGDMVYHTASSQCKIIMDLALIKMDCQGPERPEKIYLKERFKPPIIPPGAVCGSWETDSLGVSHQGDGKNHIKVVGKLSRTGIYSFGIVNDFRAALFPFTEDLFKTDKETYAWAVSSDTEGKPFSIGGDSGSFVIAAQGWEYHGHDNRVARPSQQALEMMTGYKLMHPFVVGLLFATTKKPPLSYFIPFDAVKPQIESLTGEKLVWPRKRSDCVREGLA
ncbi:hypothetical protein ZTR_03695 [Talaromyces verruculosus]|nr:hypothetical protein ZTR_03695 [Talaromyces verruculosus]